MIETLFIITDTIVLNKVSFLYYKGWALWLTEEALSVGGT